MGKLHSGPNWLIRVQANEHPPVHVHVLHPDGSALVSIDGTVINSGVPTAVMRDATAWIADHIAEISAEWARMNNPPIRSTP